jgi:predicted patatin/cPLA2 family phospholipase
MRRAVHKLIAGSSILLIFLLAGCEALLREPAPIDRPPPVLEGFKDVRYYPMNPTLPPPPSVGDAFINEPTDAYEKDGAALVYNYLAVSGGGSDGAFGAGLLKGWSESGKRPKFKFVTGVSTGALIAPFAFLGPDYDETLKEAYTTVDAQRLYLAHDLLSLLWEESFTDNKPFREMIARFIDDKLLARIAEEHKKGRRLYVLTTDLDREEPVVWDMGAIASGSSPDRLELFRKVILASASIPAFFPPVLINVKIDGVQKDELHVDGGVFAQAFFVGNQIDLRAMERRAHPNWTGKITHRLYVIRNGRLDPQPRKVDRTLGSITAYSIDSMLKASGVNDLYRLYLGDLSGELELRYVAIPHDYVPSSLEEFNQAEMIQQYNLGLSMGERGIPWQRTPPGYQK